MIGTGLCTETCCMQSVRPPHPEVECVGRVVGANTIYLGVVGAGIAVCMNPPVIVLVPR